MIGYEHSNPIVSTHRDNTITSKKVIDIDDNHDEHTDEPTDEDDDEDDNDDYWSDWDFTFTNLLLPTQTDAPQRSGFPKVKQKPTCLYQ